MDFFAQIARNGIGGREELLYEPQPMKFEKNICELNKKGNPYPIKEKISTNAQLKEELALLRKVYQPFLRDLTPKQDNMRLVIPLERFMLEGKEITIPYYGGPIGKHKQVYTTSFEVKKELEKAYYICFKGADYYAVVYVNDICVGTHEGFFSPFEFDISDVIVDGRNTVQIDLYNDYNYLGIGYHGQTEYEGDKLYACTGLGWDDPEEGWHHCKPGMGLYHDVSIEVRNRINITDVYVRPLENTVEVWTEIEYADYEDQLVTVEISIYGQNFEETVVENYIYTPQTMMMVGLGDSLTESMVKNSMGKGIPMPLKHGKNIYKIPMKIEHPKIWEPESPYLYQVQIKVCCEDSVMDCAKQQFGMRCFYQDVESEPKGMFYLNGRKVRLRGANTMGFEQQDVLRKDYGTLIDDILLAKLCNMNFFRLTQRPVQDEVYEYCDKLGFMTQTDLPLFGCMRRNKVTEGIRQVEEMERLIRKHPCNVLVSYINEPFPNANNKPHRHLTREELEQFFSMCDAMIKMQNPERVIKHVDGDYDPPTEGMPDNHCYPMWYNGHGIDIGKLHKGYWLSVKPNWYYGCGEYGIEGLDSAEVMKEYYPSEWLQEPFDPGRIVQAQTKDFHYFFYDTQETMEDWIEESQKHQAFGVRMMTEAFRRDDRMVSNAIHLFIDAWPAGWMKTIMDCKRNPKKAYFAYRDALEPVMVSLRTDRFTYYAGETISIEAYLCNDTNMKGRYNLKFEYYVEGDYSGEAFSKVIIDDCRSVYAANAEFAVNDVTDRKDVLIRAILLDESGDQITYNELTVTVYENTEVSVHEDVVLIEKLPVGIHEIAGETVTVKPCGMLSLHFVSRKTGHKSVSEFGPKDFAYWYDQDADMITPILDTTFEAPGFTPILVSGNMDENGRWKQMLACAEKEYEGKRYVICQVDLREENPVAKHFKKNICCRRC